MGYYDIFHCQWLEEFGVNEHLFKIKRYSDVLLCLVIIHWNWKWQVRRTSNCQFFTSPQPNLVASVFGPLGFREDCMRKVLCSYYCWFLNRWFHFCIIFMKDGKAVNYNGSEIIGLINLKYGKRTACRDNFF